MATNGNFFKDLLFGTALGIAHSLAVNYLSERVPEPYMDEQFHVGQTRLYCKGVYNQWNLMITTPPALYFLAAFLGFCGRERLLNSLLIPLAFAGLCRLRRRQVAIAQTKNAQIEENSAEFFAVYLPIVSILALPVLLGTSFLFYTDLLSLTAVAWGLGSGCPFHSFLAFTLALLTRQTNIVWAAFYCFPFALEALNKFLNGEVNFIRAFLLLIRRTSLHILLAISFLGFIFWNGGSIVLGDKSAHKPVNYSLIIKFSFQILHLPQLLYFFAFTALTAFPLLLAHFVTHWRTIFNRYSLIFWLLFSLFALGSIHCCTHAHPYLLADNRHFTFYIWQRLFQRHWMFKYALVPFYGICAIILLKMAVLMSQSDKVAFVVATGLCLVPAQLLEFRYFIIPYALWRCSLGRQSKWSLWAELLVHLMINGLTIYLFLERPFRWPNEPGKLQRFMW